MTAVPKPLKFLGPHYATLVEIYQSWADSLPAKKQLADIISILAMSYGTPDSRESLKYRLAGTQEDAGLWGHEYVRHLSSELMGEYIHISEEEGDTAIVVEQAISIIGFFMKHNAEADAVDLLLELELLDRLPEYVDKETYKRVGLYLLSTVQYLAPPDDITALKACHKIYLDQSEWTMAIQVALRLRDHELIVEDFKNCPDIDTKKQLAFILARQQIFIDLDEIENNGGGAAGAITDEVKESIQDILRNTKLSQYFLSLAKDLDVLEPKTPDDIYKLYLENSRDETSNFDSARKNLASTFVNAFVNAGFGKDKLLLTEDSNWVFRNRDHGMLSTVASLGALHLWDLDNGLSSIDKYQYSEVEYVKAGALLAIGLVNTGIRNESDPALALLSESLENPEQKNAYIAAIIGLGMSYVGSAKEEVVELLLPIVNNDEESIDVVALAALSLGLVFVGQPNGDIIETIVSVLMTERKESDFKSPYMLFMGLGLALMFLGKQEQVDSTIAAIEVIENPFKKTLVVLLDICAYAGTGNVLKVQTMLHHCNDHIVNEPKEEAEEKPEPEAEAESAEESNGDGMNIETTEEKAETPVKKEEPIKVDNDSFQGIATIGIALIAMGEDIGSEMALRSFDHLMHYGEPVIRRSVPLALALLCPSNPIVNVLDVLSKYSHDNDPDVSRNAIFAMGIVGAGTNNARLDQMLRQLATYYSRMPKHLFVVRIAQGLVHLGKGTMSINPFNSNRFLMSNAAVAGLLVNLVTFSCSENIILGSAHYLLYYLLLSAHPRHLMTFNPELEPIETTVRVGQAVDVVGQAGRPKTITGFQTHTTPVLLAYTERAELATEEYLSLSSILEGFVVLKKNPDYEEL